MHRQFAKAILLLLLLLMTLGVMGCSAIKQAPEMTPTADSTEASTDEPVAADSAEAGSLALTPSQISLDTQGMPISWQAFVIPEKPYDQSMPPGPVGLPAHIEILFGAENLADTQPGDPIMYIIPVNPYRQMWNEAGNPSVTKTIARIDEYSTVMPRPLPTSGMPVLPYEQATGHNDLAVQIGRILPAGQVHENSATQDGYRFVGRWAQSANLVTNQGLRYVYQGFTNDGVYLVSFWWPVSTSALPVDMSEVTAEQQDQFQADPTTVMSETAAMLNGLSTDQWEPGLATLDALVASLQIEGMVAGGIQDTLWEWVEGPSQPGSSEIVIIPEPSQYQVTYGSDGVITYVADCNSGSMPYELQDSGTNGSMLAEMGPLTLAECGPDSYSSAFLYSLQAAQGYRVQAGGYQMRLVLPAGGGTLIMRAAGAPSVNQAVVSGTILLPEGSTLPEGALITVQLQDTSLADAPATVVGEQVITGATHSSIPFAVAYDPSQIQSNHSYSLSVRITDADGTLLFINDTNIPVVTRGNPTESVTVPVVKVNP